MTDANPHVIYLISDGTCLTCDQLVKAGLLQFGRPSLRIVRRSNVRCPEAIARLVSEAAGARAIVFYTLVEERTREAIQAAAQQHTVPAVDLLGPVMVALHDLLKDRPNAQPGLLHHADSAFVDRVNAIDFTLEHDDGRGLPDLPNAEVVLVGVSRASKSTTCFYLAYSGVRAANVPLFADSPPPKELLDLDPRRVIGLTANPHRLQTVRESRMQQWNMSPADEYGSKAQIARELRAANEQMREHGWKCIDTSYKAIEEVAREVLLTLESAGIAVGHGALPGD